MQCDNSLFTMATSSTGTSRVLILGHSFVRRRRSGLQAPFDNSTSVLPQILACSERQKSTCMAWRTVPKLWRYDLRVISKIVPDILILEIGTNYLSLSPPEAVGSDIEDLVRLLIDKYAVNTVVLCQITPRVTRENSTFICWTHRGFCNPAVTPFLPDGAHLFHTVQYTFYTGVTAGR